MKKVKSKKEEENDDTDDPSVDGYKFYKEKPYENSSGNPFGVSINGRVKEYIQAHKYQGDDDKGENLQCRVQTK